MRFRFFLLSVSFLCAISQPGQAQEPLPAQNSDDLKNNTPANKGEPPTVIKADSVEAKEGKLLEATGDAEIRRDGQLIRADRLRFNQESNELQATGSVRVQNNDTSMSGPRLDMNLKDRTGVMVQPVFNLSNSNLRGSAESMHIEGKQVYSFEKAIYTSCPAGNDDWLLKMSDLELDRNTQIGTAYNARIEFMGVPILYTPWMNFPLTDRRRSGLLGPVLGSTDSGGNEITIPFYWNIASNYDATLTPRFIEKRGTLFDNEFRYMGNSYTGKVDYGEILNDKVAGRDRSHSSLVHMQNFGAGFTGSLNLNEASDDAYFRDLSNVTSIATQKNLLREGALNYSGGWWMASARAQSYQTLQDPDNIVALPYRRLPQVNVGAQRVVAGSIATFNSEYVNFNHPTAINGSRVVVYPSVAYPLLNDPAYYVTPKLGVHHTQYSIGDNNTPGAETKFERTVPIFSVDSGMTMERDFAAFEHEYVQTLEPRVYYVNIPYRNQDTLPNFDSAAATFSFMQMFTENRFLGSDRIGDADQITTALTSRLLDADSGNERLRFAVGQRFSRQTPRVTLLGAPTSTTNLSDILVGVGGRMTPALTLDSLAQYNPNESRTEAFSATARYLPEAGKVLNLGYRYTFNADPTLVLKQVDFSTQWLLTGRWNMVGKVAYSLKDSRTVEALAGLEYNQDCWTVRFVAQQFVVALKESPTSYFLQLELNELIRVGTDPISTLKLSVPGYTVLTERPREKPVQSVP